MSVLIRPSPAIEIKLSKATFPIYDRYDISISAHTVVTAPTSSDKKHDKRRGGGGRCPHACAAAAHKLKAIIFAFRMSKRTKYQSTECKSARRAGGVLGRVSALCDRCPVRPFWIKIIVMILSRF
ncbi:hypothetical protein EVAR_75414_1 [Eumeta japonica]|uniref:Uncharacterized protein n=1 Tax=Eumeta variegata TaxID=151549 RepID=A0A4C1TK04_EUMVA|nr:hypothetical protein EVAR_75414_1 [Eumeta japonica]